MTLPAGVLDRTGIGNRAREDLADIIYNISPTECPFTMLIGRSDAEQDAHEHVTDVLAAAVSTNRHVDGDDFSAEGDTAQVGTGFDGVVITAGNRIGNHCQIGRKDIVVSRRANLVRKAGRKDELGYQIAKAGRELKRDVESSLLANNAAVQGSATVAGQAGSYLVWMRANSSRYATTAGTDGADPAALVAGFPTGTAAVDASLLRALSEVDLLDVIGDCYIAGGEIDTILMHPTVKQKFSRYMFSPSATDAGRIATQYQDQGKSPSKGATALGAIDVYVSDFGVIDVIPDRFQRSRDVIVMESDLWAIAYLDPYQQFDIAKSGDSEKRVLLVDYTLEARNSGASGIVADIDSAVEMVFDSTEIQP
ncbi:MAG: DUF5309 family protein [Candidatus Paceibacterota bacterium]|jgi:hypothetical protein